MGVRVGLQKVGAEDVREMLSAPPPPLSACLEVFLADVDPMDRCEDDGMNGNVSRSSSVMWDLG